MESIAEQANTSNGPVAVHTSVPFLRLTAVVLFLVVLVAVLLTLGQNWGGPPSLWTGLQPKFRYVNSGWVSPLDWQEYGPFSKELRAFVIVDQDELDAFQSGFVGKASRGNPTSLGRIDFETSILLAAYYIWRPVKGDPLSVVDIEGKGYRVFVHMELDNDAQGREYAYLYAPMAMVAVQRSLFAEGEPYEFVFELADHPPVTVNALPN